MVENKAISVYKLFTNGEPIEYFKGEIVVDGISETKSVYYIEKGYIKVYSISNEGEELIKVIGGPGDVFPFVRAYLGSQTSLFYEAMDKVFVWRITSNQFQSYIHMSIEQSNLMAKKLARQYAILVNRIDNLEYKKASDRIAYCLLILAQRFGISIQEGILIDAPLTHDVLANTVKLARESVSRELERLEGLGIIDRQGRYIVIKQTEQLSTVFK